MTIRAKRIGTVGVIFTVLLTNVARLGAQTNTWLNPPSGKWEIGTNWSFGGPPSPGQSVFIVDTNILGTTATIDGTTSTNYPGTLTISNLTIFGHSLVSLTNAGTNVPLHVLKNLSLGGGGSLSQTRSAVRVDGLLSLVDGAVTVTDGGALNVANGTLGIGNDGTTTNGAGTGVATINNTTVSAVTLNLGSTAGGLGLLTLGSNVLFNVGSNFTVVSGSLVATSSVTISGGSFTATNGLTQIGPAGSGLLTVSGGNHAFRRIRLGSTNGVGTGTFHFVGGHVTVLGNGIGPGQGLSVNKLWWAGGELDSSGTSLTIGDGRDGMVWIQAYEAGQAAVLGQFSSMYVGYTPGYVGTYLQEDSQSTIIFTTQVIVGGPGDCGTSATGSVTVTNGMLCVTNDTQTATLEVRNGTVTLKPEGTLVVDHLVMTTPCGRLLKQPGATLIQNTQPDLSPDLDADGDGQSNAAEMAAGTDPLDPTSLFRITAVAVVNLNLSITWTTVTGHNYVVQSSTTPGGPFSDCSPAVPAPAGGESVTTCVIVNGAAGDKSFLRVKLLGP